VCGEERRLLIGKRKRKAEAEGRGKQVSLNRKKKKRLRKTCGKRLEGVMKRRQESFYLRKKPSCAAGETDLRSSGIVAEMQKSLYKDAVHRVVGMETTGYKR